MAAHRCTVCSINYPSEYQGFCPVCGDELACLQRPDPDEDWIERAAVLRKKRGDNIVWEGVHPKQRVNITIFIDQADQRHVSAGDLENLGYRKLKAFDVVRVNGDFYELQGLDHKRGTWWIEEIQITSPETE